MTQVRTHHTKTRQGHGNNGIEYHYAIVRENHLPMMESVSRFSLLVFVVALLSLRPAVALADHCLAEFETASKASSASMSAAIAAASEDKFTEACTLARAAVRAEAQMNAIVARPDCVHDKKNKKRAQVTTGSAMADTICALQATSPPARRDATGSSLAPGTTDKTDTTEGARARQQPKRPDLGTVHMGNSPVGGGEKPGAAAVGSDSGGPDYGLSEAVRAELRRVKDSPAARVSYLRRLSVRDRAQAIEYLSDPAQGVERTVRIPEESECRGMRARLSPHAPNDAWIIDQMARSHCNKDGTPMTLREATKYEMYKGL